ncbi:hypothetical protein ACROYT_G024355 [Oculina patagonica]
MALTGNEDYKQLKESVISQKRENKVNPSDLYKLASLLARWKPNDKLPVCLLCRDTSKKPTQLGHIFPHSVLKKAGKKKFFDLTRGTEAGISKLGYHAFCGDCEKRFKQGEDWFNPQFFEKLVNNPQEKIQVGATRDLEGKKFPWLYYTLISIIWRLLCFYSSCCEYIEILELFRNYLLDWEASQKAMDSMVELSLFAPNSDVTEMFNAKELAFFHRYFYNTFHPVFRKADRFNKESNGVWAYIFCGPLHVKMNYNEEDSKASKSFEEWETLSMLTNKDDNFTIGDQDSRIFPVLVHIEFLTEGSRDMSWISQLLLAERDSTSSSPAVQAPWTCTYLHLLPRNVSYNASTDKFELSSDIYKEITEIVIDEGQHPKIFIFVKAKRGNEKILFVAVKGGFFGGGEIAMGLNVDPDGKVSCMKGAHVRQAIKCSIDLKDPPFKKFYTPLLTHL